MTTNTETVPKNALPYEAVAAAVEAMYGRPPRNVEEGRVWAENVTLALSAALPHLMVNLAREAFIEWWKANDDEDPTGEAAKADHANEWLRDKHAALLESSDIFTANSTIHP